VTGPDFEMPPDGPPDLPVDPTTPVRPMLRRRVGIAAAAVTLGLSGAGALAWFTNQGTSPSSVAPPAPSTTPATLTPSTLVATTSTTRPATPTTSGTALGPTCVDSADNPEASNGSSPDGFPWITFRSGPRASRTALTRIAQDTATARDALGDAGAVGVRVYCSVEEYAGALGLPLEEAQALIAKGRVASALQGDIWLFGPSFEKLPPVNQHRSVYHEYFHLLQRSLSRLRTTRTDIVRPLWLIEGSARFFENAVTPRELDDFRRRSVRQWAAMPSLEELEQSGEAPSSGGTGDAYTIGAVAADYLATTYGRELVQRELWVAFGTTTDWRAAFAQVFGVPVEQFYSDFATYRQGLRP